MKYKPDQRESVSARTCNASVRRGSWLFHLQAVSHGSGDDRRAAGGRALAREWASRGIRVNAIAPGYIATEMNQALFATPTGEQVVRAIPQRRLGSESDLDGALLLLASPASRYMTGSVLVVDGGYLLA